MRLRTSGALKRVEISAHDWLVPYLDRLITEIGALDQASAQWTLAYLFGRYRGDMTDVQYKGALKIMKRNLAHHDDWIVLNTTMETLATWSVEDKALRKWLKLHLVRLAGETRKSIANWQEGNWR